MLQKPVHNSALKHHRHKSSSPPPKLRRSARPSCQNAHLVTQEDEAPPFDYECAHWRGGRAESGARQVGDLVRAAKGLLREAFYEDEKEWADDSSLRALACSATSCECTACLGGGVGLPILTREDVSKGGVLAAIADRRAEMLAHGGTEADLPGAPLGKFMTKLVNAKAFRLTGTAHVTPTPSPTPAPLPPTPLPDAVGTAHPRAPPAAGDSPTGSPTRKHGRPSPPSPPRVGVEGPRTRADTAAFEFGDADQLPDVDIPDGPVDLRDAFTYAFKCIAQKRCFLFKQYELVASGRDGPFGGRTHRSTRCTST